MRKLEKVAAILFLAALIFRFNSLPGGKLFLNLSTILFVLVYMFLGFAFFNDLRFKEIFNSKNYRNFTTDKTLFAIVSGISMSVLITGIYFKINHWPGSAFVLILGVISSILLTSVVLIKKGKNITNYTKGVLIRLLVGLCLGILFFFINIDLISLKQKFPNKPELIQLYEKHLEDVGNDKVKSKFMEEYKRAVAERKNK